MIIMLWYFDTYIWIVSYYNQTPSQEFIDNTDASWAWKENQYCLDFNNNILKSLVGRFFFFFVFGYNEKQSYQLVLLKSTDHRGHQEPQELKPCPAAGGGGGAGVGVLTLQCKSHTLLFKSVSSKIMFFAKSVHCFTYIFYAISSSTCMYTHTLSGLTG